MKKILSFSVVLVLIISLLTCVNGAAFADSGLIEYKGQADRFAFAPGSDYTVSDLFSNSKGLMPGDSVTENLSFRNSASDCDSVVLYMKVAKHSEANPLSEGVAELTTVEENNSFLSSIDMVITGNSGAVIYSGKASGASSYVQVGSFSKGEGTDINVTLSVPLTAGNEIAGEIGEVDLVFQVQAYSFSQLTVNKVWSDGADAHTADSVQVQLLRTEGSTSNVEKTAVLNAENNWTFTFNGLDRDGQWSVKEVNVPSGYTASYSTVGNEVTITNTTNSSLPQGLDITVAKKWASSGHTHQNYVYVGLYDGSSLVETQRLDADNGWTYKWYDTDSLGFWTVKEVNIPSNYYPTYVRTDNSVEITNTYQLVQTGQLKWPVAVLALLGTAMTGAGIYLSLKKKNEA